MSDIYIVIPNHRFVADEPAFEFGVAVFESYKRFLNVVWFFVLGEK